MTASFNLLTELLETWYLTKLIHKKVTIDSNQYININSMKENENEKVSRGLPQPNCGLVTIQL